MSEVLGDLTVVGRTYLRDHETGRFLSAVKAGSRDAAWELGDTMKQAVVGAIMGAGLFRSGELAGSIRAYMVGSAEVNVIAEADHAAPLEKGAVAHWIPNSFGWGIALWHPGNIPYRFFEAGQELVNAIGDEIVRRNMP